MKQTKQVLFLVLSLTAFLPRPSHSSVLLTDFSASVGVDSLVWNSSSRTWTGTQVVGLLYNDGTGPFDLTSVLSTAVSNSAGLQAEVTAVLNTSVPAGSFRITLENTSSQVIFADFNWSDFVVSQSKTVAKAFQAAAGVTLGAWNRSSVANWNLVSSGNLTGVDATFTGLSVIPEPASASLFIFALASGLGIRRLRSRNQCNTPLKGKH